MNKIFLTCLLMSNMTCSIAETTYYSDGSYSQSNTSSSGTTTTYNSDGTWSTSTK